MKKLQIFLVILVVTTSGFWGGCKGDDTVAPTVYVTSIKDNQLPDSTAGWLYFSFDTETVIPATQANTDAWDIKFRFIANDTTPAGINNFVKIFTSSGPIFLNSPNVGNPTGKTKGYVLDSTFATVSYAGEDSKFRSDDSTVSTRIISNQLGGPNAFFIYDGASRTVSTNPSKTLMIQTKGGKYVKMQLSSLYQGKPVPPTSASVVGYYSFNYVKSNTKTLK
ncbi:MAG: HmuY family protein [Bacteroidetes bacterium]|nr:HmuY family protein [Bacteroidota bacterium]